MHSLVRNVKFDCNMEVLISDIMYITITHGKCHLITTVRTFVPSDGMALVAFAIIPQVDPTKCGVLVNRTYLLKVQ